MILRMQLSSRNNETEAVHVWDVERAFLLMLRDVRRRKVNNQHRNHQDGPDETPRAWKVLLVPMISGERSKQTDLYLAAVLAGSSWVMISKHMCFGCVFDNRRTSGWNILHRETRTCAANYSPVEGPAAMKPLLSSAIEDVWFKHHVKEKTKLRLQAERMLALTPDEPPETFHFLTEQNSAEIWSFTDKVWTSDFKRNGFNDQVQHKSP